MGKIYLDYAAATPVRKEVLAAMKPYFTDKFYNPSATYLNARQSRIELGEFRSRVANILGARPSEIIFTSGATESNNLAVLGISKQFPGSNILISSIEHESVMSSGKLTRAKKIPVNKDGLADLHKLKDLIDKQTVLLSVMFVNNEIGSVQPLREIAHIVAEERIKRAKQNNKLPIYFHSDCAQATNYLDLNNSRLSIDLMSINGSKIYGPKGIGCLYIKTGTNVAPLMLGGGQEFGVRSGTENLASIAGFAAALKLSKSQMSKEHQRVKQLRDYFEERVMAICPEAIINGGKHRAPHICSVTFPGMDNETLMMQLDEQGIECAVGSACSASSDKPSYVLEAIGLSSQLARSTLRFSFGAQTRKKDIEKTVLTLDRLLKPS